MPVHACLVRSGANHSPVHECLVRSGANQSQDHERLVRSGANHSQFMSVWKDREVTIARTMSVW